MNTELALQSQSRPKDQARDLDLVLLMATMGSLRDAGVDTSHMPTVNVSPSVNHAGEDSIPLFREGSHFHALRSMRLACLNDVGLESTEPRLQLWSQALVELFHSLQKLDSAEMDSVLERLLEQVREQYKEAPADYNVLSAQEMADRMSCTAKIVYDRERSGRFFSVLPDARMNGRRFPSFQLSSKLDRGLFEEVLEAFRFRGVSSTILWSFLRRTQREFDGKTMVEMLLGGQAAAYDGLSAKDRAEAIMDVVAEELSRVA